MACRSWAMWASIALLTVWVRPSSNPRTQYQMHWLEQMHKS